MRISFSVSSPSRLRSTRPCKKHVRFQDEPCRESVFDYSFGKIVRDAKVRRYDGKSPEDFDHFHVGGTTLCADYAKRAMLDAAKSTAECDQRKRCKYSNNYPSPTPKRSSRFSSIFVWAVQTKVRWIRMKRLEIFVSLVSIIAHLERFRLCRVLEMLRNMIFRNKKFMISTSRTLGPKSRHWEKPAKSSWIVSRSCGIATKKSPQNDLAILTAPIRVQHQLIISKILIMMMIR